jgi:hypothetical protein
MEAAGLSHSHSLVVLWHGAANSDTHLSTHLYSSSFHRSLVFSHVDDGWRLARGGRSRHWQHLLCTRANRGNNMDKASGDGCTAINVAHEQTTATTTAGGGRCCGGRGCCSCAPASCSCTFLFSPFRL